MTPAPADRPAEKPCECGPNGLAKLLASEAFRNGRAEVREALARDYHAAGEIRTADGEYQRAKAIRAGTE
jgi:hypothetical protein